MCARDLGRTGDRVGGQLLEGLIGWCEDGEVRGRVGEHVAQLLCWERSGVHELKTWEIDWEEIGLSRFSSNIEAWILVLVLVLSSLADDGERYIVEARDDGMRN